MGAARDNYTSRGDCVFSPWNDSNHTYSLLQLDLGTTPLTKLEVVSMLNACNISRVSLQYYDYNRPKKYYIKLYLGTQNTVGFAWNFDMENVQNKKEIPWLESF